MGSVLRHCTAALSDSGIHPRPRFDDVLSSGALHLGVQSSGLLGRAPSPTVVGGDGAITSRVQGRPHARPGSARRRRQPNPDDCRRRTLAPGVVCWFRCHRYVRGSPLGGDHRPAGCSRSLVAGASAGVVLVALTSLPAVDLRPRSVEATDLDVSTPTPGPAGMEALLSASRIRPPR